MRNPFSVLKRETIAPVEGTSISLQDQISAFWSSLRSEGFSPRLIDNVWSANRCITLNAQQIASMPLRFYGTYKPAWVSSPDPTWYPNGIGDALKAAVRSYYGWGDAFLVVTARYASGFPSAWTVLDPATVSVQLLNGRRSYRANEQPLNPDDVVQISRNPMGLRGQSALSAYGAAMWGSVAAGDLSKTINDSGVPNAVIKSHRKLTDVQARKIQDQWVTATASRRGAPAILPPELDFTPLAFSPKDLLLLDAQEFNAKVIATAFGVPPFLLNMALDGGLTYQNPEMLFEVWWRSELRTTASTFANALTANMLPASNYVEFDARDVLAPGFRELVHGWWELLSLKTPPVTIDEFRAAVLRLPAQAEEQDSIEALTVPTVAATTGTTPTSENVQLLRPVQEVGT